MGAQRQRRWSNSQWKRVFNRIFVFFRFPDLFTLGFFFLFPAFSDHEAILLVTLLYLSWCNFYSSYTLFISASLSLLLLSIFLYSQSERGIGSLEWLDLYSLSFLESILSSHKRFIKWSSIREIWSKTRLYFNSWLTFCFLRLQSFTCDSTYVTSKKEREKNPTFLMSKWNWFRVMLLDKQSHVLSWQKVFKETQFFVQRKTRRLLKIVGGLSSVTFLRTWRAIKTTVLFSLLSAQCSFLIQRHHQIKNKKTKRHQTWSMRILIQVKSLIEILGRKGSVRDVMSLPLSFPDEIFSLIDSSHYSSLFTILVSRKDCKSPSLFHNIFRQFRESGISVGIGWWSWWRWDRGDRGKKHR
jgi:hypothetical protein